MYKSCYCLTCGKAYHHQGIMRHRAMHRDRKEYCEIEYGDGRVKGHSFDKRRKARETS